MDDLIKQTEVKKTNRVMIDYAVTRRQKREIAKINMKKAGKKNICRHSYTVLTSKFNPNAKSQVKNPSYFSEHWKEYVEVE